MCVCVCMRAGVHATGTDRCTPFPSNQLKVLSQLDAASILCVAATCSEFYSLASDGHLWRNLYTRDFGPVGEGGQGILEFVNRSTSKKVVVFC